jgi:hypothetical protein
MLFVIDDPGDLGGVEPEFVDQDAARPHARRDRIGAHAHLPALEILRMFDSCVRADQEPAVVEAAHDENRQGNERSPIRAGDDVGGRGDLADVELDPADHAAERADLRNDLNEVRRDAGNRHLAAQQGRRVGIARDCEVQLHVVGQGVLFLLNGGCSIGVARLAHGPRNRFAAVQRAVQPIMVQAQRPANRKLARGYKFVQREGHASLQGPPPRGPFRAPHAANPESMIAVGDPAEKLSAPMGSFTCRSAESGSSRDPRCRWCG